MNKPHVIAICATKGRHRCAERILGFFKAQTYNNATLLIYNNHEIEQTLLPLNVWKKQVVLVNNHIDTVTGESYQNLGAIYRDAMKHAEEIALKHIGQRCLITFMDDDDGYLPDHFELGVEGYKRALQQSITKPYKAYRPDRFINRYLTEWRIDRGMYAEPTIFVEFDWIYLYGFDMVTGAQHHGWLKPLLEEGLLYQDLEGQPTLLIDWSQEIPTWKTSGDHTNPENWNNYIQNSQDHGDRILTAVSVDDYYQKVIEHFPEFTDRLIAAGVSICLPCAQSKQQSMHAEVDQFLEEAAKRHPEFFQNCSVLEVGSLNINGTVRNYFKNCNYLGLDLSDGPGVDITSPIHEFQHPGKYDVIVSTEMLEHDKYWESSLKQMYDNLKPGGLMLLTCAGPARAEHGTTRTTPGDSPFTTDYYRNISKEDFMRILPAQQLFQSFDLNLVRGDNDLQFWGIKADRAISAHKPYDKFCFITAQPDERVFAWETEVQIANLKQWDLHKLLKVLVYWIPSEGKPSVSQDWLDLRLRYPEVEFHFFKEDPTSSTAMIRSSYYASIIRPYMLQKLWEKQPELEQTAVFYLDSDVIFTDRPPIEEYMTGAESLVTNTEDYLGCSYLRSKAQHAEVDENFFIEALCNITSTNIQDFINNNTSCGGAQYVLKGVTTKFWEKVLQDIPAIRKMFMDLNRRLFVKWAGIRGLSVENAGVQSWCADMWAMWCAFLFFKIPVKAPKNMDSAWTENALARKDTDLRHAVILHNAGNTPGMFRKTDFRKTDGRVGAYYNRWPWEVDLGYVDMNTYSKIYVEAIQTAKQLRDQRFEETGY